MINTVGVIGLVFGALTVLRYLFDSDILAFSDAPTAGWGSRVGRASCPR